MAKRYERIEKSIGSYGIVRRDDGAWCADFRLTDAKGRKIGSVRYVNITIGGGGFEPVRNGRAARTHASISVSRRIAELEKKQDAPSGVPLRLSNLRDIAIANAEKVSSFATQQAYVSGFRRILGGESANRKVASALIADLKIEEITEQNIIDLSTGLSEMYKPVTVNQTLGLLKAAWNILHAKRVDYRQYPNPINMKQHGAKVDNDRKKDLTPDQIVKLFSNAEEGRTPDLYLPLIHLTFGSGLRIREARHLRGVDLDEDEDGVFINVCPKEFEGNIDLKGKSKSATRTLHISDEVGAILKARKAQAKLLGTPWLFWSPDQITRPVSRGSCYYYIDLLFGKADISLKGEGKSQKWHAFRHTFASVQLRAGVSLDRVSELLGHSSIMTTHRYYHHLVPKDEAKVAAQNTANWLKRARKAA